MNIAIIPARGGSKRIPHKNIKEFYGKPMVAWSIEAAKTSRLFEHIIVSTDDEEIADIAKCWGAEVPFMRPAELSNDFAGTTEVIAHATEWAQDQGWSLEAVCCIYATAPFVQKNDLKRGLEALRSGPWAYAFTATEFTAPIFRAFRQIEGGGVEMFMPDKYLCRSQDLPNALHDAGQFYWGRPESWINSLPIFDHSSIPVLIPSWRVQDIDTISDWIRAEIIAPAVMNHKGAGDV